MTDLLIQKLENKLTRPLPGTKAQSRMTPSGFSDVRFNRELMDQARLSGVLILLYKKQNEWYFPLTLRHQYNGAHSGQVSLPGGKKEDTDENVVHTALREAREEVGITPGDLEVMGQLTDLYIPPSNFKVTPTLAYTHQPPRFEIDTFEVKELIETPLSMLADSGRIKTKPMEFGKGYSAEMPYFDVYGHVVWGATAMILSELAALVMD
ncbi:MAG: CoA pyrophosphatase [Bacteroidota bacterium]